MKRNFLKKLLTAIMAAGLVITSFTPLVADDTVITAEASQSIPVRVTFDRSGAQSILGMINSMRTGSDAWYWNSDNSAKTTCTGLSQLKWDSGLEQAAMQRAAEIALSYSHTRPDGSDTFSAYQWNGAVGENIAAGYRSASAVNSGWREDDKQYSGQGHRRNMLSDKYSYVGIAHVTANGTDYWVEEFSAAPASAPYSYGDGSQTANVNAANVTFDISTNYDISEMKVGETVTLPEVTCFAKGQSYWGNDGVTVDTTVTASIGNTDVAELNGNSLTAKKAGTFDVTFSCAYCNKTIRVTVREDETKKNDDTQKDTDASWNNTSGDKDWNHVQQFDKVKFRYTSGVTNAGGFVWIEAKAKSGSKITFTGDDYVTITDQGLNLQDKDGYYIAYVKGIKAGKSTIRIQSDDGSVSYKWTVTINPASRSVRFNTDGGSYVSDTTCKGSLPKLPVTSKKGYIFDGWYTSDGARAYDGMTVSTDDDSDIVLTAHWKKDETAVDQDKTKDTDKTGGDGASANTDNDTSDNTGYDEDDTDSYAVIRKPAKVTSLRIRRSGKKAKISWKRKAGTEYRLVIRVGKKTYRRTTYKGSYTVKAKKGQKVTVRITAVRYDDNGRALKSKQVSKTKKV